MISNRLVKQNTINSRECLSVPKEETIHDDSINKDDTISHYNTISYDDACILKANFNCYQIKFIKNLQSVNDTFLIKLSDMEQNLQKNLERKEFDEKYERLLNQLEKKDLFWKNEIRRKYKVINILLDNFSNRVPEDSNYLTSKNTEVSTQTNQKKYK